MGRWINLPLFRNPANWFTVALMLAIPAIGATVIRSAQKMPPQQPSNR